MTPESPWYQKFLFGRYAGLLAVLVLIFLVQPWVSTLVGKYCLDVLLVAALFAGLRVVQAWKKTRRFLIVLLAVNVVSLALGSIFDYPVLYASGTVGRSVFLVFIVLIILKDLFKEKRVTGDTLAGAVCVYLLIAVIWTNLYLLVEFFVPESFSFTQGHHRVAMWLSKDFFPFFYFSLVTMTTVGYGDMSPVTTEARTLATMEAIAGQIYLTILVARLVGMHLAYNLRGEGED